MPRRLLTATVLGLAISPWPAQAMDAEALYYDQDYQASYEAYDARLGDGGKHQDELEYSAGTAAFKAENYAQAAEHLGRAILANDESLRSKAYYNLGNTLFRLGQASEDKDEIEAQWQSAIDHYAEAEALGGEMERNARHNREVVEQHLAALKGEEPPESEDQQQQQDQNQDGEEGEEGQDQEQKQDQGGEQQQDSQDQKSGEEGQDQQQSQDGQEQEGQDQQQSQDGQEQEGKEGEQQQDQQSQEGQEGNEGEQEQGQQGKPGDEDGKEEDQASSSSQEEQPGEEGKQAQEAEELDGEVKAADDKGQKPDGDPQANEGPQKPSAYELTPDGKLSEAAARALLESLEGEEVKAPFEVRRSKQRRRVIRDW